MSRRCWCCSRFQSEAAVAIGEILKVGGVTMSRHKEGFDVSDHQE